MSHYLTQPEEIDCILMNEKYDAETDARVSDANPITANTLSNTKNDFSGAARDITSSKQSWRTVSFKLE
jgi:hypothetical protein